MKGNKWLWYFRISSLWGNKRLPYEQLTSTLSQIQLLRFHKGKWSRGVCHSYYFEWQPVLVLTGVQETQTPHLFCSRTSVKRLRKQIMALTWYVQVLQTSGRQITAKQIPHSSRNDNFVWQMYSAPFSLLPFKWHPLCWIFHFLFLFSIFYFSFLYNYLNKVPSHAGIGVIIKCVLGGLVHSI